jgi:serine/threonine-protein kinase
VEKPSTAERQAFLDEACGGDGRLRRRIERLLAADEHDGGILNRGIDTALLGASRPERRDRPGLEFVVGSKPKSHLDLRSLLRRRLLLSALLLSGLLGSLSLLNLPRWFDPSAPWWHVLVGFRVGVLQRLLVISAGGLAFWLWRHRTAELRTLRIIELALVASVTALLGWVHCDDALRALPKMAVVIRDRPWSSGKVAAQLAALRWFALLVAYGTLIPNTGRRCALVVGLMAATPLVLTATWALLGWLGTADLAEFFPGLAAWLAAGAAIAVYGSHRIEVLRREAVTARQLGEYRLKERLDVGGMGEVYLAEHVLLKQPCAVKLIRPERAGDPETLCRFEREVQATARLKHWNTVRIYDYGHAEDGTFYYAMEYLPGLTLEQLVSRYGPLPPARAIHFLRQVCAALQEAHRIGLIHRDIKPGNIIACERGGVHDVAKLVDFGLVRSIGTEGQHERLTQEGAVAGTPAYMSPEQAGGEKDLDARNDIYSLGAVAYYLLAGQPPFRRAKAAEVIFAHIHDQARRLTELRPQIPADLEAIVLRCLEKDPSRRFPEAQGLARALASCQTNVPWNEDDAAAWWRSQAGSDGEVGSGRRREGIARTER